MPDLAAIRKRYEAATEGPWLCDETGWPVRFPEEGKGHVPYWSEGIDDSLNNPYKPQVVSFPTLDFIAHARTDLPAVVEALEEAKVLLKEIVNAKPARLKAAMFAAEKYLGEGE